MRRYWLDFAGLKGEEFQVVGDSFKHIFQVCRTQEGDEVEILVGDELARLCQVKSVGRREATLEVMDTRPLPQLKRPYLHLALSLSRWAVMDSVVEKMVELGVHSFHPLVSHHSSVGLGFEGLKSRHERWKKIGRSALRQTGRAHEMVIHPVVDLADVFSQVNRSTKAKCLFFYEGGGGLELPLALDPLQDWDEVWAVVGPEGGFSRGECDEIKDRGFPPVSLGPQILRVETACVCVMSILKYELNLL